MRRAVSLPPAVAERLDHEAERRGVSFSALVAELADEEFASLPYSGLIDDDDDDDLSMRVEEVLARLAG